jgi:hypothetical protein
MKTKASFAFGILCVLLFSACGPTKYVQNTHGLMDHTGYDANPVDSSTYLVSFEGNTWTTADVVDRYALFRAAEITNEKGFDYFVVMESHMSASDDMYSSTHYYGTTGTTSTTHAVSKTIRMAKGTPPANSANTYVAKSMLQVMAPNIER